MAGDKKPGPFGGVPPARAAAVASAAFQEPHDTEGDPPLESAWQDVGTYTGCRHMKLTGLTP